MNSFYAAYAAAHGMTQEEILRADAANWSGGIMTGFFLWIADMERKFYEAHPGSFMSRHVIADYDAWKEFCINPENWNKDDEPR